jgi:nucleoside triphosphate diphosphatase
MKRHSWEDFKKIIAALRHPQTGCPWDLEQTHQSLIPYLIEESYELVGALEDHDLPHAREEMGDVLLQLFLHAQLASENNQFEIEDVVHDISTKMIERHPHVFSDTKVDSVQEVKTNWEAIKGQKAVDPISDDLLHFPALMSSYKIGKASKKIKFDWQSAEEVWPKVEEEFNEFKTELASGMHQEKIEEELGDLLFSLAQLARHLKIDPENCLRKANLKFHRRFKEMLKKIENDQLDYKSMDQKAMDHYWDLVKDDERKS